LNYLADTKFKPNLSKISTNKNRHTDLKTLSSFAILFIKSKKKRKLQKQRRSNEVRIPAPYSDGAAKKEGIFDAIRGFPRTFRQMLNSSLN